MRRAACLSKTPTARLSESMDRATIDACLLCPAAYLLAETVARGVGTTLASEEQQIARGRCVNDGPQLRMQWDGESRSCLLLPQKNGTVTDMLAAHMDKIRGTLSGVDGKGEG
jgi:hypothetical protein